METKLELRHIAPYLPWGLKIRYEGVLNGKEIGVWEREMKAYEFPFEFDKPRPDEVKGLKIGFIKKVEIYLNYWKVRVGNGHKNIYLSQWGKDVHVIMRPLSDLTKDEYFDLYMDLCEELGMTRCEHLLLALQDKLYYAFDISKLEILETFMYKNHFDWKFNLIQSGLAIDINSIKP